MANGDLANTSGQFVPVSSGAEYRLGYDDINRLADAAARIAGANAWELASAFSSFATGFGSITDPNGLTTGAIQGGLKRQGLMVSASFFLTYTGATLTSTNGNFPDTLIATLGPNYRPAARRLLRASSGAWSGTVRVQADGGLVLVDMDSGASLTNPTTFQVEGIYPL